MNEPPADGLPSSSPGHAHERGRLLSNILGLGTGAALAKVVAFLGTAYLARVLGPEGFGIVGWAAALCSYFTVAVQGGFPDTGIREVSRHPDEAAPIAASAIAVRLAIAGLALALLVAIALLLPKSPTVKLVTMLTGLSFVTIALDAQWVHMGLSRHRNVGMAFVFAQLGYVGVVLLAVRGPGDVALVPIAQFLGDLGAAIFLLSPLVRRPDFRVNLRAGWTLVRGTSALTMTRFLRTVVLTLDVVMIGYYMSLGSVGLYTSGYRICYMVLIVVGSVHAAYLPGLTQAARHGAHAVRGIAQRSIDVTLAFAVPVAVGGALLGTPLLATIFGAEFAGGGGAFGVLLWSIALLLVSMTLHDVILVYDRMPAEVWVVAVAAGSNVVLNTVLIPRYGLIGAAGATLLSELVIFLGSLVIVERLEIRLNAWGAVRPLAASAVMAATLLLIGTDRSIFLLVPAGGAAYVAGLALVGGIPRDGWPIVGRVLAPIARRAR